jgi:hypothetical protein
MGGKLCIWVPCIVGHQAHIRLVRDRQYLTLYFPVLVFILLSHVPDGRYGKRSQRNAEGAPIIKVCSAHQVSIFRSGTTTEEKMVTRKWVHGQSPRFSERLALAPKGSAQLMNMPMLEPGVEQENRSPDGALSPRTGWTPARRHHHQQPHLEREHAGEIPLKGGHWLGRYSRREVGGGMETCG